MSMHRRRRLAATTPNGMVAGATLLKAIADAHRLRILMILAGSRDPVCVCEFTEAFPLNQPTISHHLRILREAGLVACERRGTWVYYALAPGAKERLETVIAAIFPRKKVPK